MANSLEHIRQIEEQFTVASLIDQHRQYTTLMRKTSLTDEEKLLLSSTQVSHAVYCKYQRHKRKVSKLQESMDIQVDTTHQREDGNSHALPDKCDNESNNASTLNMSQEEFDSRRLHPNDDQCNDGNVSGNDCMSDEEDQDYVDTNNDGDESSSDSSVIDIDGKIFLVLCFV